MCEDRCHFQEGCRWEKWSFFVRLGGGGREGGGDCEDSEGTDKLKQETQEESNNGHKDILCDLRILWTLSQSTKEQFWFDVRKSFETLGGVDKVELCGPGWCMRRWCLHYQDTDLSIHTVLWKPQVLFTVLRPLTIVQAGRWGWRRLKERAPSLLFTWPVCS